MTDEALGLRAAAELVFHVGPVPVGLGDFARGRVLPLAAELTDHVTIRSLNSLNGDESANSGSDVGQVRPSAPPVTAVRPDHLWSVEEMVGPLVAKEEVA